MVSSNQSIFLNKLYEQDFYLGLEITAKLLNEKRFQEIDLENLIDEIKSIVRREQRELKSRLTTLVEHLIKLIY